MISVEEAFDSVIKGMPLPKKMNVPVWRSPGHVLGEDVKSDIPMPPFDRSAMDGFALRGVFDSYELLPEIPAGADPPKIEKDGQAAPIMTGAPVPEGADRVVMVEDTHTDGARVHVRRMPPGGANICVMAEDIKKGQTVLEAGTLITPARAGIASMAGRSSLRIYRRPTVCILTTGSEVIPPVSIPLPGQVRDANGPLIASLLSMNGYQPTAVLHSADDPASLRNAVIQAASISDVLVTAGGISMGTRDYIPTVFEELGYNFHFRTVAQKPGKPFSFSTGERVMFGLPGNPVSVLVTLEMYVLPALRYSSGHSAFRRKILYGKLETDLRKKPGRQCFFRCRSDYSEQGWAVAVPETSGSGDLMSAGGTNSIAWLPPESSGAGEGDKIPFSLMSWAGGESIWE